MNIKVFGFTWELDPPNKIEDFLKYINSLNSVEMQSLDGGMPPGVNYHRVVLTTDLEDGLWGGVFLTVKNARKFLRSRSSTKGKGKGFKISTGEIGTDENFADANFFIYNPKTKAGLYEYYHLSAHLNTFNFEFLSKFKLYRSVHHITGKLHYTQFLTKSDLDEKINELAAVHHVEYELSTITPPQATLMPASGMVKRQRTKVFYESRYQASDELKEGVTAFIRDKFDVIKRLFVKGKNNRGDDVVFSIMSDPSIFDEREFKNFSVNLDVDDNVDLALRSSSNLKHLIAISKKLIARDFFYTEREP